MNFPLNRPEELRQNVSTSPILLKLLEESRKNYIHWHDHAEILLILEGFQRIEISGRLYEFKEGDFMWLSPRVIHSINPDESRPSKFYSMLYDETYVFGQSRSVATGRTDASRYYRAFLDRHRLTSPCIRHFPHTESIRPHLDRMYTAFDLPDSLKRDCILRGELLNILAEIADSLEASFPAQLPVLSKFPIEPVCHYIDSHSGNLKLEDAASHFGYSRNSFAAAFTEALGHTFREYTNYVRMMEAARMLAEGGSIAETAYRLGYNNVCNFSRAYRRYTGVPPSAITYLPLENQ